MLGKCSSSIQAPLSYVLCPSLSSHKDLFSGINKKALFEYISPAKILIGVQMLIELILPSLSHSTSEPAAVQSEESEVSVIRAEFEQLPEKGSCVSALTHDEVQLTKTKLKFLTKFGLSWQDDETLLAFTS